MVSLLSQIKTLNRKERFHLLHDALGFVDQTFVLGHPFRARLSARLDLPIPFDAYVAMDYQIVWLERAILGQPGRLNIQDVDLLVAFDADPLQLVLIEAKCDAEWDESQLASKVARLSALFEGVTSATPHFVFTSIVAPNLQDGVADWPEWMRRADRPDRPYWFPLQVPAGRIAA